MSLIEKLEHYAKLFDRERWERPPFDYNADAAELSDTLKKAAQELRGWSLVCETYGPRAP